ncbi:MAG TPA: ABC transporter substrate-binding protein, partial [Methanothrix sp.]|nr:ABC transporter substrate-binding protein [Methanothrix sp.]
MKIAIFALVALALAATPASAALGIFGNANMDDTIDQLDTDYVRGIIDGNNERTDLADANRDGAIDEEDIAQIEAIINGEEKVLNILDGNGDPVAVHKPVERIVVEYLDNAELVSILNSKDKVVGVDYAVAKSGAEFPDLAKRKNVGQMNEPDYEAVLSPDPNLLLTFSPMNIETKAEKLPGVDVVFLGLYFPDISDPENSRYIDGVRKLGYILDEEERAEEFISWNLGWVEEIRSRAAGVSEEEQPKVLICAYPYAHLDTGTFRTYSMIDTLTQMSILTGVKVMAEGLPEFFGSSYNIQVDPEWVIEADPDLIYLHLVAHTYSGLSLDPANGYDATDPEEIRAARDAFTSRPELAEMRAVKEGRVYLGSGSFR